MRAARRRSARSAASARIAVLLLVVVLLCLGGYAVTRHAVDRDREVAAQQRADADTQQLRGLLDRARTLAVGLANAMEGERAPDARRFAALVGSGTATVGLTSAMWMERVTARGRRAYERRIRAPITRVGSARPAPAAATYYPATFVTGLPPLSRGDDVSGLPALASTLRDPASIFAGTATPAVAFDGRRGFFVVQGARFGRGPGSRGFLVLFVPAAWLSLSLDENPDRVAISLDGARLAGALRTPPAATQSFEALTRRWRLDAGPEPAAGLQSTLPWLAVAWPPATALLIYLVGRGMLRRRRAERQIDDIFDVSLDPMCIAGLDGYLKRVNPAFEHTLGYDAAALLARPLVEFVHPDDRDATTRSIGEMRHGNEVLGFENRYVRADGAVRWLQWNTRPILHRGRWYGAARDVTDTRVLVDEQAALRRVATLVARGHEAGDLFNAVAVEVGQLLGADATRLLRFEPGGVATVVAGHGASDAELGVPARPGHDGSRAWSRMSQGTAATRTGDGAQASTAVVDGVPTLGVGAAVAAAIVVSGRPWGVIVAAWRQADMARPDTEVRMAEFTELVATAVANAESRAQLAASRQRIVATADETRRRIEHDLHDGAQQQQIQTIFVLRRAQRALSGGSGDPAELVERALESAESANDELRELARGIHPAVLNEGGLVAALKTLARRCPIPVVLDLRVDGRLPERVEVTAYYVVSEALTNAAKHSNASVVHVTVEEGHGDVRLSITDDGDGGANPASGSGLVGLRDRVEAARGTLSVDSRPGAGTHITVELVASPRVAG